MNPHLLASIGFISFCFLQGILFAESERPNILWITSEDNGQELGCYGDRYARTPNLDKLASESLRYQTCWSNAPVCAPARTTIISGMYATSLGAHHMRSGVTLPKEIKLYPQLLREAGYYTTNHTKTDYNFDGESGDWHDSGRTAHWRNRPNKTTPFFSVFNFTVSHESKIRSKPHKLQHDPSHAPLPAYHPDTPEVRRDWAQYYDKITEMDTQVGNLLKQLKDDNLTESTIILYYGDHGSGMPRSKRWPFDSGLRVPLLLHVPEQFSALAPPNYQAGGTSDRLVSFVDLAPTTLNLAGVEQPSYMQGSPFAGKDIQQGSLFLFGFRGRMDERIDMVRSCTDGRYVYMRHFYPERPYLKHVDYMFQTQTTRVWKRLFDEGQLNEAQAKFWKSKPVEELFDLQQDPSEVNNLAKSEKHAVKLKEMRDALRNWMIESLDLGVVPEAEMHRLATTMSPRTFAKENESKIQHWIRLSFDSLEGDTKPGHLQELAKTGDSVERFWAIRGLALKTPNAENLSSVFQLINDESPSVAIAACDATITHGSKDQINMATDRLIELANVESTGHFAAIAALNVIDMNSTLSNEQLEKLKQLPRSLATPPTRVGKYVGKLIDHATSTSVSLKNPN